jgi:casein kinase 1
VAVTDTYGPSLEALFDYNGRQFCLKTVLLLAEQLISRLEFLHSKSIVHCNLSPKVLALGGASWQGQQVFLINFNVAQKYTELGPSASCDLEALGQILIYLCGSKCSWTEFQALMQEKGEDKTSHLPPAFTTFLKHVASNSRPNFPTLRQIFRDLYQELNLPNDRRLDFPDHKHQEAYVWEKNLPLRCKKIGFGQGTGAIHAALKWKLAKIGTVFNSLITSLDQELGVKLTQSLSDVLELYMNLLLRGSPSQARLQFLPSQLWRDLQWYFAIAEKGSMHLQKAIVDNTYKFMAALVELVPFYKIYWMEHLVFLAEKKHLLATGCERTVWAQIGCHWQDHLNHAKTELESLSALYTLEEWW